MKRLFNIILILTGCTLMQGCSLDIEPDGYISNYEMFQNKNSIDALFATTYASLPIEDFNYSNGRFGYYPTIGYNTAHAWSAEVDGSKYSSSSSDNSWDPAYNSIYNANILIRDLPTSEVLSDEEYANLDAEAHFLRAFSYYFLVRIWGGVPLVSEPVDYSTNDDYLKMARSQEEDIWDFIMSDLDIAIEGLSTDMIYGRANKYVALAFKSRVALYAASIAKYGVWRRDYCTGINPLRAEYFYGESMSAAKAVIESELYSLYDKYVDPVENYYMSFIDTRLSEEVILAKGFDYYASSQTHSWDCISMPHQLETIRYGEGFTPHLETLEMFEFEDGRPADYIINSGYNQYSDYANDVADLFDGRDPRMFASIVLPNTEHLGEIITMQDGVLIDGTPTRGNDYGQLFDTVSEMFVDAESEFTVMGTGKSGGSSIKTTGTGFFMKKYVDPDLTADMRLQWSSNTDFIVIRLAEIYLNYVEAAVEMQSDLTTALTYLNLVKSRAGVAEFESVDDLVMDRIIAERYSELCFEGFRYWDMVRRRTLLSFFDTGTTYGTARSRFEIFYDYDNEQYLFNRVNAGGYSYDLEMEYYRQIPTDEFSIHSWVDNYGY